VLEFGRRVLPAISGWNADARLRASNETCSSAPNGLAHVERTKVRKLPLAGSSRMVSMSSMSIVRRSHLAYDREINSSRSLNVVTGRLTISRPLKKIEPIRKAGVIERAF
jgi:hypothetical protein